MTPAEFPYQLSELFKRYGAAYITVRLDAANVAGGLDIPVRLLHPELERSGVVPLYVEQEHTQIYNTGVYTQVVFINNPQSCWLPWFSVLSVCSASGLSYDAHDHDRDDHENTGVFKIVDGEAKRTPRRRPVLRLIAGGKHE